MKYSAALLAALFILLALAVPERAVAKKHDLTLKQIMSNSSRAEALTATRSIMRANPTPKQLKVLRLQADKLRMILRPRISPPSSDPTWASLIAPVNRCTDLVRKVCGVEKQCAASGACAVSVQILDLYNSQPTAADQYSLEENCIISLADDAVFPSCQP